MSQQQQEVGPAPGAGPKPKREISPARLAANRANSRRSTGPRSPEGKAISKFNGLVHGMRAESDILPGEDPAELDRRIAAWADELGADNGPERYLAEAAAKASWRIDRCRAAEAAALTRKVLGAGDSYDDALADEVEQLSYRLAEEPSAVVRQLRRSTAGCRWLIGRWGELADRLDGWKGLEPTERRLAANLMGKRSDDLFDPAVARLTVAYLGALRLDAEKACPLLREDRPEGMCQAEFDRRVGALCAALPDSAAGHAQQVAIVAEAIDELCERLDLVEAREGRDRELAVREASFDASPAAAFRLRYEMSHERVLRASLRDLRALRENRTDSGNVGRSGRDGLEGSPPSEATTVAPTEAIAPTEANATEAIATEVVAPTEANATEAVAPTEAKTEAEAVAPTESEGGSIRPGVASLRREIGASIDAVWFASTPMGVATSLADTGRSCPT